MHFLGENNILVRIQGIRKCQQFDQNSIDDSFCVPESATKFS